MPDVKLNNIADLKCPEAGCGAPMVLQETKRFKRGGRPRLFYGCTMWRVNGCKGSHAAHPDGSPMGIPADKETKEWRIKAHEVFDVLWKKFGLSREESYSMLQDLMKLSAEDAHIGKFTAKQCQQLIERIKREFPASGI